jgi:MYXO-CTERM domain-containing protein
MRSMMISALGLAAMVATSTAMAGEIGTSVDEVNVSNTGQMLLDLTLASRLAGATMDAATVHSDDDDDDDDVEEEESDDTGGEEKGCNCATASGPSALAALLPLALVGFRRRQN